MNPKGTLTMRTILFMMKILLKIELQKNKNRFFSLKIQYLLI